MLNFLTRFKSNEDGAVTVDWVILTAAICLVGVGVGATVGTGAEALATDVSAEIAGS